MIHPGVWKVLTVSYRRDHAAWVTFSRSGMTPIWSFAGAGVPLSGSLNRSRNSRGVSGRPDVLRYKLWARTAAPAMIALAALVPPKYW